MTKETTSSEAMTKKALNRIRALARGNGVQKDSIQLIRDNSEMVMCEAITHIELTHETKEERKSGQQQVGELVEDLAALPQTIEKITSGAIKNVDTRKALANVLLERPDKGFAIHAEYFDIAPLNKEFSSFQPCKTCQGQGQSACQTCGGRKIEQCSQCHGRTTINCNFCRGSGFIKAQDGSQKQCNHCFGKCQIRCPLCQSRGTVSCRQCRGTGSAKCNTCDGVGVFTSVIRLFFKMKTLFEIDRAALPAPALKLIENNGGKLVTGGDIKLHGEAVKREDGGLAVQYKFQFPYIDLDVGVNGKPIKIHMFGYKARMLKVSNFLDQLVEKNYALLQRAAANDGNVVSHIRKASKTRMIGEGLLLSVTMRPKKAMMLLKKKFPFGASNDLIKGIIMQSNKALVNITRKSHLSGLGIGLGIAALANAAYFLGPLRPIIGNIAEQDMILTAIDFLLIPIGGAIALVISKHMTASPLKKALGPLMPERQRSSFKPRNQNSSWPAFAGSVVVFLAIVLATKFIGVETPSWLPF